MSVSIKIPADASIRRSAPPVIVYPNGRLPEPDWTAIARLKSDAEQIDEIVVAPRDAATFRVPGGHFFRIVSIEGPQVGDLNLWHANDLSEHFFSGKTRALHATHVPTGHRLWSNLPSLRPMRTIPPHKVGG